MISSYAKVMQTGHRTIAELFIGNKDSIFVQEKVDGSQFSFKFEGGGVQCRSKSVMINEYDCPAQFRAAFDYVRSLKAELLPEGWVYRGEVLDKPKHNTLKYDRVPKHNIILFDIERGDGTQDYIKPTELARYAELIDLEAVPVFFYGSEQPLTKEDCIELVRDLKPTSILGGVPIEGVVIKNYEQFDPYQYQPQRGKIVSDDFKELHQTDWKGRNPNQKGKLEAIKDALATEARWVKAVQHLRDEDKLTDGPEDIGPLMKEVQLDVEAEKDEVLDLLWEAFGKELKNAAAKGLPEWYKQRLLMGCSDE